MFEPHSMTDGELDNLERRDDKNMGHYIVEYDGTHMWVPVRGGGEIQITFDDKKVTVDFLCDQEQIVKTMDLEYSEFTSND